MKHLFTKVTEGVIVAVFTHPLATGVVCVGVVLTSCVVLAIAAEWTLEACPGDEDDD